MGSKWIKSGSRGVRYREHETRKHGVRRDRYFVIRYKLDGKDKEESLGWASEGWTEARAVERLAELKANIRNGAGPQSLAEKRELAKAEREAAAAEEARKAVENVTFGEVWPAYFAEVQGNKSLRTIAKEEQVFRLWLAPAVGKMPMRSIAPLDLERLKKHMADAGLAPRSTQYALAVLRQVFHFANRHGLFDGPSPTAKVKMPTADNRRLRFLTHEEAGALLGALKARSTATFHHALLSLHCGLRFGEIAALTWSDVDMERGVLTLRDTKSGKTRMAFMTGAVREALESLPKGKPVELVFPGRGGVKMVQASDTFNRAVAELALNTGLVDSRQKVVFHSLRHTFASWLVENGTDLYTVKELMGHADFKMVSRYAHLSPEHMRKAVQGLEASIKAKAGPGRKVLAFRRGA